ALQNLANQLNSQQIRFFSIVRKTICNQYGSMFPLAQAVTYPKLSQRIFGQQSPVPQDINNNQDSFNLCDVTDFTRIFDGINNSILDAILGHKYDYWPVAQAGANIDPNEIVVSKNGTNIP